MILCWGFWSIWTWVFCRVIHKFYLNSIWTLLHEDIELEEHHLLKMFSLYLCMVLTSLSKLVSIGVWVYVWIFNLIPLINLSVSIPISHSFYYYCYVARLEVRESNTSRSSFIVQGCFSYPGIFGFFHMKLRIILSKSVKNCVVILMGIVLNL